MKARLLAAALCFLSASAFGAWHSVLQVSTAGAPAHSIAFSSLANGTVGGSPIAGSGTYTGTAPSSLSSATWGGGCSGSSTPASFSASAGTWSATFTVPGSAGTGCTIAITDNLADTATSPGVTISSGSYTGPIDIQPSPTAWYGLRAGSAAIAATGTQKSVNVIRASDSHTCDVLIATSGGLGNTANCGTGGDNGQTLASFLTSTTGKVVVWYDQSGNGHDLGAPVAGNRPAIIATGKGAVVFNGSTTFMNAALAAVSLPISYAGAINPTGAGDSTTGILFAHLHQVDSQWNGHYIQWGSTSHVVDAVSAAANSFGVSSTTATLSAGTTGAVGGVYASATSRTAYLNGTAATTNTTSEAPTTQDTIFMGIGFATTNFYNGNLFEMGYWPANASANMAAISANEAAYGY